MDKKQCNSCGETKCSCKDKDFTKAVIEIDNHEQITLMRKVVIPVSMGDDTTVPPVVGKYHNVLLYYEANSRSYLYSSDGIPTQLVNGITNYEDATNLPQINGVTLLEDKSAADLGLADAPMVITVANGNTNWSGADTAEDVYNFFLNKGKVNIIFNGGGNYAYEIASAAYIPEEEKMMCTLAVATITTGETAEFEGNALFGTMTLYTADKAIDVSQIELQPKLFVTDFTGLDLNYNELSGVPATNASIGMVKPGDGLEVDANGTISISDIEQYAHFFDTVADMKAATNLKAGDYAKTSGFYAVNDGGGTLYKITDTGTANEMDVIAVGGLFANLILENEVNIKQLGAKPQDENNTRYDIKAYIDRYLEIENIYKKCITLYIPSGIWYTSGNLLFGKYGWHIKGDEKFSRFHTYANGTLISSYNNNQSYILRLGDGSHSCHNWVLENLTFSSADFIFSNDTFNFSSIKNVSKALELHHAIFGITDNIFFNSINGKALTINGSWGNYFKLLNFYKVSNENSSIMNFETVDSSLGDGAGIIGNNFANIMFEMCHGHLMNFEATCNVYNNHFDTIRVEPGKYELDGRTYTDFTDEILSTWDDDNCAHYAIFNMAYNCKVGENVFNNLELNNVSHSYYTYNSINYVYDTIIYYHNNCVCNNIYNNINDNGMLKDCKVIYIPTTVTNVLGNRTFNTFNNFSTSDSKNFIFDVNGLNDINVSDSTYLRGNRTTYSFANQSYDYFKLANWVPAYKAISKRQYLSGVGNLYYDKDAINNINLVVTPRTDITDIAFINTAVGVNKKLYLRAKIPNGEVAKINIINRTASDQFEETLSGTGDYTVYEISLTNTWNVGDYIRLTPGGSDASVRVISIDCFLPD